MQGAALYNDQEQKDHSGPDQLEKILQTLPQAYGAQGD